MNPRSIFDNVISNLIWVAIVAIVGTIYKYYSSLNNLQWILLSINIILIIVFFHYRHKLQIVTGILRIDRLMKDGISPEKALSLCKNNIKFLGIAANKLVNSPEFEKAIKRCNRPGKPIKFLLSSPDNIILKHAARRANKELNQFKEMVNSTLRKLKQLKQENGYNIEIRLYKSEKESGPPSFRLFFIDDTSVLVSYYIFGEGEGLQMPQMQIIKTKNKRDVENFYYAFEHYFNSLWEASEIYE